MAGRVNRCMAMSVFAGSVRSKLNFICLRVGQPLMVALFFFFFASFVTRGGLSFTDRVAFSPVEQYGFCMKSRTGFADTL